MSDPSIPAALEPVVIGPAALHDFVPTHQSVLGGLVKRDRKTGVITSVDASESGLSPQLTYTGAGSNPHEDITPYDFATIYNLLPLWNAGIDGAGVKIAIAGVSDIEQSDLNTFRSSFGLPPMTLETIHDGADPGIVPGGTIENTADVEWSGAAAKNAQIVLVTASAPGLSMQYIIDNKTAPIMSASYGECESELGTAGNSAFNGIYKQGAAEGISIFISSGDQGATGCDKSGQAGPAYATQGLQVNGLASSPYVTGVGGTDFNWYYKSDLSTYWNASQNSQGATAKGYIPELPWDPTCTSQWLLTNYNYPNALTLCGDIIGSIGGGLDPIVYIEGGSGGRSSCTTNSGTTPQTCGGGYAKPAWQAGVTGIPNDGKRDVPDVSLFAAGGWEPTPANLDGSAYLVCLAAASPQGCDYSDPSYIIYQEIGGTSLSSPAMAGIMAMVVQKMGGKGQGLANTVLYKLAGKENYAGCDSDSVAAGNGCVFYDITKGTNAMVCQTDSVDCNNPSGLGPLGISSGYNSGVGYDQTTGLGSVNAKNLVYGWAAAFAPAASFSTPKLTFASTKIGSSSAIQSVTVKNTGLSTLDIKSGGITIAGAGESSFTKTTNCPSGLAASASCSVSVTFKPKAAGAVTATLEIADNAAGSPQKVTLSGTGTTPGAIGLTPVMLSFPDTPVGTVSAAQTIAITNTTTAAVTIKSITVSGANVASFIEENNCGASLAKGAGCTVVVALKPGKAGKLSASLSVSDSASSSPQTAALSGTGSAAPSVKLSKTALTFSSTKKGVAAAEQSVTVNNAGVAALEITSIAISGANASSFTELNTCPSTLAPAANCVIYVDFAPAATGALSASVTIADDGAASPQTITLKGTGAN